MQAIANRLHDFMGVGPTLLGIGLVGLVSVKLLVGCVEATVAPSRLRHHYWYAVATTIAGAVPFVGSVVVLTRHVLLEVLRSHESYVVPLLHAYVMRNLMYGSVILLLGLAVATAPALIAVLSSRRTQLATERRQPSLIERQRWAVCVGSLVAAQLGCLAWLIGEDFGPLRAPSPSEGVLSVVILLALLAAICTPVALPLRAAKRPPHASPPRRTAFTDPSRFAA